MASIIMGSFLMGYLELHWLTSLWILSAAGIIFAVIFLVLFRNIPPVPVDEVAGQQAASFNGNKSSNQSSQASPFTVAIQDGETTKTLHNPYAPRPYAGDEVTSRSDVDVDKNESSRPAPRVLPFRVALKNRSYVILLFQQFLNAGSDVVFALILGSYFRSLGVEKGAELGILISLPLWGGALGGIFGGYANDWAINRFSSRRWSRSTVAGIGLGTGGALVISAVAYSDPRTVALGLLLARFFADWNQPTVWGTCTDLGGRYSATVFGMTNMCGNMGAFLTPFAVGVLLDFYSTVEMINGAAVRTTNYVPAFILCGGMMLTAAVGWLFVDCTQKIVPETDLE